MAIFLQKSHEKTQATNLQNQTSFFKIPCKVYPHKTLNTSRGIIRHPELRGCSDEEITENLKKHNVTSARRIKIKKNGIYQDTNTIILTFCVPTLPKSITAGYLKVPVEIYIPNPMICHNCQRFGHTEKYCKNTSIICPKCGTGSLDPAEGCVPTDYERCRRATKCIHCFGNHLSLSRDCPKWKLEKEVLRIKYTDNISFPEARKIVESKTNPTPIPTISYSEMTKTKSWMSVSASSAS